jgi:hypothetical protein
MLIDLVLGRMIWLAYMSLDWIKPSSPCLKPPLLPRPLVQGPQRHLTSPLLQILRSSHVSVYFNIVYYLEHVLMQVL